MLTNRLYYLPAVLLILLPGAWQDAVAQAAPHPPGHGWTASRF